MIMSKWDCRPKTEEKGQSVARRENQAPGTVGRRDQLSAGHTPRASGISYCLWSLWYDTDTVVRWWDVCFVSGWRYLNAGTCSRGMVSKQRPLSRPSAVRQAVT